MPKHPNAELLALLDNPTTSHRIKGIIPLILEADPADTFQEFDLLADCLERRMDAFLARAQEPSQVLDVDELVDTMEAVGLPTIIIGD